MSFPRDSDLNADIRGCGLALTAPGRSEAGVSEGAKCVEEHALQPAGPVGHQ